MQVPKINAQIALFRDWLQTEAAQDCLPVFETVQNWQTHFNVEAKDLAASFDLALDSKTNRRHYRRGGYDPKRALLTLMKWEPEFVREAFRDLFSEDRDLDGRAQRFGFYVNELFNRFRDERPKDKTPSHYHNDEYQMASLYLAGQYPEVYAPYSTALLQKICTELSAKDVPVAADFPRYTKLLKTLRSFLTDDAVVMERYQELLRPVDYQGDTALLVWLFLKSIEGGEASAPTKS